MLNKEIFESSQTGKSISPQKTGMRERYSPKTNSIQFVKQVKPIPRYFKKANEIKIETKQDVNIKSIEIKNNVKEMKSEKSKRPIIFYFGIAIFIILFIILLKYSISSIENRL